MRSICAMGGGISMTFRDLDPVAQALIERRHEHTPARNAKLSNHRGMGAADDFDDFPLGAPFPASKSDADDGPIALHRTSYRIASEVNVTGNARHWRIGDQKSEPIAVHAHPPGNQIFGAARNLIMARPAFEKFAARH